MSHETYNKVLMLVAAPENKTGKLPTRQGWFPVLNCEMKLHLEAQCIVSSAELPQRVCGDTEEKTHPKGSSWTRHKA